MAFEDKTPELLLASMLDNVDETVDKREGSVAYDLLYPAAIELANSYVELDSVLGLGFAETTEGIYLDLRAGELGITRKSAVKAQGSVTLTGPVNTVVPAGTRLQTTQEVFFVTLVDATLTGGTTTVTAEAELGGKEGNVAPGTITALAPGNLYGVVTVTNALAFDGGTDTEDDASLLQRLKDRVQRPATSGNANHYRQWALEVAGVGDVKVLPVWNGGGTVKVVLLDSEKTAPAPAVVTTTTDYITTQMPIGVTLTVVGATETQINVSATLTLTAGYTLTDATAEITVLLTDYLKSLAFVDPIVRYTKIAALMFDSPSVVDYTGLTINGGTANVTIAGESIAVIGTVVFT